MGREKEGIRKRGRNERNGTGRDKKSGGVEGERIDGTSGGRRLWKEIG